MKKKVIKLNEAQFRNMISKTIKRVLRENAETGSCIDCDDCEDCDDFNIDDFTNDFEPDQEALDMAPKMPHHLRKGEMFDDYMVNNFNAYDYFGQI